MSKKINILLCLLFLATTIIAQDSQKYTNEEGGFEVMVKGEFIHKITTAKTQIGELTTHHFIYQPEEELKDENILYMITYTDYPSEMFSLENTDWGKEFLDVSVEESAKSVNGTLLYQNTIKLGTHEGRQWRVNYLDDKATIKTHAYLVGRRYYSIQTVAYMDYQINEDSNRFFDSFKLLKTEK